MVQVLLMSIVAPLGQIPILKKHPVYAGGRYGLSATYVDRCASSTYPDSKVASRIGGTEVWIRCSLCL